MKIGILGGTFDPVHRGHTYLAHAILEAFDLSRVNLMVSRVPPHKKRREIT
ncbi:MAG: adenylyltransferase/cytidyltransferase family protein, partial [Acidobacteria bacterium]|nr:adenylyltransferase/cytidyltransferase family protein [Acidobacteriota bacterium]